MRILILVAACLAVCLAQQVCESTVLWEDCMDGKVFQAPCSNGTITILYPVRPHLRAGAASHPRQQ